MHRRCECEEADGLVGAHFGRNLSEKRASARLSGPRPEIELSIENGVSRSRHDCGKHHLMAAAILCE